MLELLESRREVFAGCCWGSLKEKAPSSDNVATLLHIVTETEGRKHIFKVLKLEDTARPIRTCRTLSTTLELLIYCNFHSGNLLPLSNVYLSPSSIIKRVGFNFQHMLQSFEASSFIIPKYWLDVENFQVHFIIPPLLLRKTTLCESESFNFRFTGIVDLTFEWHQRWWLWWVKN